MVYVKWFLPSKQTASLYIIIILHQTATGWYSPSIHAPAGGATPGKRARTGGFSFNSRARRGRDAIIVIVFFREIVSIHAPAGGATVMRTFVLALNLVSIHAPAGGATRHGRPHSQSLRVSIHAPAGGATRSPSQVVLTMMFQFTRPQGARLAWSLTLILLYGFNSRARRGRDRYAWFCVLAGSVSIHAPAGGATQSSQTSRLGTKFQFTRPQGARLQEYFNAQRTGEFQFTRPQGARRLCKIIGAICVCFNSRARRGRDIILL